MPTITRSLRRVHATSPLRATLSCLLLVCATLALGDRTACAQGTGGRLPDPVGAAELDRWLEICGLDRAARVEALVAIDEYHRRFADLRDGPIQSWLDADAEGDDGEARRRALFARIETLDDSLAIAVGERAGDEAIGERLRGAFDRRRARVLLGSQARRAARVEPAEVLRSLGIPDESRLMVSSAIEAGERQLGSALDRMLAAAPEDGAAASFDFDFDLDLADGEAPDPAMIRELVRAQVERRREAMEPVIEARERVAATLRDIVRDTRAQLEPSAWEQFRRTVLSRAYGRDLSDSTSPASGFAAVRTAFEADEIDAVVLASARELEGSWRDAREAIDARLIAQIEKTGDSGGMQVLVLGSDGQDGRDAAADRRAARQARLDIVAERDALNDRTWTALEDLVDGRVAMSRPEPTRRTVPELADVFVGGEGGEFEIARTATIIATGGPVGAGDGGPEGVLTFVAEGAPMALEDVAFEAMSVSTELPEDFMVDLENGALSVAFSDTTPRSSNRGRRGRGGVPAPIALDALRAFADANALDDATLAILEILHEEYRTQWDEVDTSAIERRRGGPDFMALGGADGDGDADRGAIIARLSSIDEGFLAGARATFDTDDDQAAFDRFADASRRRFWIAAAPSSGAGAAVAAADLWTIARTWLPEETLASSEVATILDGWGSDAAGLLERRVADLEEAARIRSSAFDRAVTRNVGDGGVSVVVEMTGDDMSDDDMARAAAIEAASSERIENAARSAIADLAAYLDAPEHLAIDRGFTIAANHAAFRDRNDAAPWLDRVLRRAELSPDERAALEALDAEHFDAWYALGLRIAENMPTNRGGMIHFGAMRIDDFEDRSGTVQRARFERRELNERTRREATRVVGVDRIDAIR